MHDVDNPGSNLSSVDLLPGAQDRTERQVKNPAAELDRRNDAKGAVCTDLKNLRGILPDR
jgi:hypothetical protein